MSEEINFNKTVFNKAQYIKTIDTAFSELGVTTVQEQLDTQPTVEEFFSLYNQLFYEIPEFGEINSHEFLIQQSSEYINFEANQETIDKLQEEISILREDLLDSQKQIVELETGESLEEDLTDSISSIISTSTGGGTSSGGTSGGGGGY
tara:strand:- start:589 stop:1035 length:447 start_codon:yes stop_codon:yes gene_type:complete